MRIGLTFTDVTGERQDGSDAFTVYAVDYPYVRVRRASGGEGRTYLYWDVAARLSGYGLSLVGDPDAEVAAADAEWVRQYGVMERIIAVADNGVQPLEERVEDIKNLAAIL